jgi:hypothetical protein
MLVGLGTWEHVVVIADGFEDQVDLPPWLAILCKDGPVNGTPAFRLLSAILADKTLPESGVGKKEREDGK